MKAVKQVANDDVVSPLPAPRLSDVIDVRVYALGAAKHAIASSDIALILRDLRRSCSREGLRFLFFVLMLHPHSLRILRILNICIYKGF